MRDNLLENVYKRLLREVEETPYASFDGMEPWAREIAEQIASTYWANRKKTMLLGLKKAAEVDILARKIVEDNLPVWKSIVDRYGDPVLFTKQGYMGLAFWLGEDGKYVLKLGVKGEHGSGAGEKFSEEVFGGGPLASYSPMIFKKGEMKLDREAFKDNEAFGKPIGPYPVFLSWHILERLVTLPKDSAGGKALADLLEDIQAAMFSARTTGKKDWATTISSSPKLSIWDSTIRSQLADRDVELADTWLDDILQIFERFTSQGIGEDITVGNIGFRPSTGRPVLFDF